MKIEFLKLATKYRDFIRKNTLSKIETLTVIKKRFHCNI
jgi:hypothetical protein